MIDNVHFDKFRLDESDLISSPFEMFSLWYNEAIHQEPTPANIATLATARKSGKPSARTLLLKDFDDKGFTFFTNYESRKGREIRENNSGMLVFFWYYLERQVCIEGSIEKISSEDSDVYFRSRPFESQLGTMASPQSQKIPHRHYLEERIEVLKKEAENSNLHRPDNWGGFMLIPDRFEFWQGRKSRLHDRFEYVKDVNRWLIHRLAP